MFARPQKELKAFHKVELKPKQTKTISFILDREAFWYFDTAKNAWAVEPGEFEILIGASSRDLRVSGKVALLPEPRATRLHTGLSIQTLMADPQGRAILTKHAGGFLLMADMSMAVHMTIEQIAANHPNFVPQELVDEIGRELAQVK